MKNKQLLIPAATVIAVYAVINISVFTVVAANGIKRGLKHRNVRCTDLK